MDEWAFRSGFVNAVRVWIRRRTRFSTYHSYVAPVIGWPKVYRMTPLNADFNLKAHVRSIAIPTDGPNG